MDFDLGRAQNEAQSHPVNLRFCSARSRYAPPPPRSCIGDPVSIERARTGRPFAKLVSNRPGHERSMTGEGWSHTFRPGGKRTLGNDREKFSGGEIFFSLAVCL